MHTTKKSGHPVFSQLLSMIPKEIIDQSVTEFDSDKYYKTMTTYKQFVFILYGVLSRSHSLNNLCKCLMFLEDNLSHLNIDKLPASSTLSDANMNRNSDVFGSIYYSLLDYYSSTLSGSYISLNVNNEVDPTKVKLFDSSTISLFVDVFKSAGRNPLNGKKKGGLKMQTVLPLHSKVPEVITMSDASKNDKDFLGQLEVERGNIYVFDKGYVNYTIWDSWTNKGVFFVTRLNENANYEIMESKIAELCDYSNGGIIKDELISLNLKGAEGETKARLITYKDPLKGVVLRFISNMFEFQAQTIVKLYKDRWEIETFFKQLKQNFELGYFFSDSSEGIKTQIWIALIANLIFTVVHKKVKECEQFLTIVSMASTNLCSYICLLTIIKRKRLNPKERNLEIMQLHLFAKNEGGIFENHEKSP
jgi:hypothetical protein